MSTNASKILVTGAGGQLGRLIVKKLLAKLPRSLVVAMVRDKAAAADLAEAGAELRVADYTRPETLDDALAGIGRLMFISSNQVGQRAEQHRNVVDAAKRAGIREVIYTSLLRADTSPLALAGEHFATETMIREAGFAFTILRNGWYTENYAGFIPAAVEHGVFLGGTGDGRISAAAREDYADAAVAVLTAAESQAGRIYELAGDEAFTLPQFVAELARQAGRTVAYKDLPEAELRAALVGVGLPDWIAAVISNSDAAAAKGGLFDEGRQLSKLTGRPTTPFAQSITAALRG